MSSVGVVTIKKTSDGKISHDVSAKVLSKEGVGLTGWPGQFTLFARGDMNKPNDMKFAVSLFHMRKNGTLNVKAMSETVAKNLELGGTFSALLDGQKDIQLGLTYFRLLTKFSQLPQVQGKALGKTLETKLRKWVDNKMKIVQTTNTQYVIGDIRSERISVIEVPLVLKCVLNVANEYCYTTMRLYNSAGLQLTDTEIVKLRERRSVQLEWLKDMSMISNYMLEAALNMQIEFQVFDGILGLNPVTDVEKAVPLVKKFIAWEEKQYTSKQTEAWKRENADKLKKKSEAMSKNLVDAKNAYDELLKRRSDLTGDLPGVVVSPEKDEAFADKMYRRKTELVEVFDELKNHLFILNSALNSIDKSDIINIEEYNTEFETFTHEHHAEFNCCASMNGVTGQCNGFQVLNDGIIDNDKSQVSSFRPPSENLFTQVHRTEAELEAAYEKAARKTGKLPEDDQEAAYLARQANATIVGNSIRTRETKMSTGFNQLRNVFSSKPTK
jgi:hypothetical protein